MRPADFFKYLNVARRVQKVGHPWFRSTYASDVINMNTDPRKFILHLNNSVNDIYQCLVIVLIGEFMVYSKCLKYLTLHGERGFLTPLN